jgi:hypothetical protein
MKHLSTLIMAGLLLISSQAMSQIPRLMNFQGILTDQNDGLREGTFSLRFRIYDGPNSTAETLWSETLNEVSIENGVFNVSLGTITPLDLDFDQPYWLSIKVDDENEFTPFVQLVSAPYALQSDYAETSGSAEVVSGEQNVFGGSGNVGIGTINPTQKLEVVGNIMATKFIGDGSELTGIAGGTGSSVWSKSGNKISYTEGSIGIGTTNPVSQLHAQGEYGSFRVHTGFGPLEGTTLLGAWIGDDGLAPQVRFDGADEGFVDIGQDASGSFVVQHSDATRFSIN